MSIKNKSQNKSDQQFILATPTVLTPRKGGLYVDGKPLPKASEHNQAKEVKQDAN